jgi:uncharacterized protein YxeA
MKLIIIILLIFSLFISCATPVYQNDRCNNTDRERYYDSNGKYEGYSRDTSYGTTRYYNRDGKFVGTSQKRK